LKINLMIIKSIIIKYMNIELLSNRMLAALDRLGPPDGRETVGGVAATKRCAAFEAAAALAGNRREPDLPKRSAQRRHHDPMRGHGRF
jgi:hypothetical protein